MNAALEKIFALSGGGESVSLPWEEFIGACLYDPEIGYYRLPKTRVGGSGADFYTASSLKAGVFSELVCEAAQTLLGGKGGFEFYEIGAEPERQIISGSRGARLGEEILIPRNAAAISNELLDARPFARFKFSDGSWKKRILRISRRGGEPEFSETLAEPTQAEAEHLSRYFPKARVEGFSIDASFDALGLFEKICAQNWRGVLIFFDYFRSAEELSEMPSGTARSYFKHSYQKEIFDNAGNADITFSPCSDPLLDIAASCGFSNARIDTQAEFFVKFAPRKTREIAEIKNPLDPRKRALAELISSANMGACFRALSAVRL